jgi:hypothetical protein
MGVELPPSPVVLVLTLMLTLIGSVYRAWNSAAAKLNASRAGWVTKASKVGLIVNASAGQLSTNDATPASNKEARLVLTRLVLGIATPAHSDPSPYPLKCKAVNQGEQLLCHSQNFTPFQPVENHPETFLISVGKESRHSHQPGSEDDLLFFSGLPVIGGARGCKKFRYPGEACQNLRAGG